MSTELGMMKSRDLVKGVATASMVVVVIDCDVAQPFFES
jgi:hypothetical protein